jgi:hypothetical protein
MDLARPRLFTFNVDDPRSANIFDWAFFVLMVFNALDCAFTTLWVQSGQAVEANPLMAELLGQGVVPFMLAKLALVTLGGVALHRASKRPLAQIGMFAMLALYLAVMVVHFEHLRQVIG